MSPSPTHQTPESIRRSQAVACVTGVGDRQEQQDMCAVSPPEEFDAHGLLAVLCDGMGGMTDGRAIAIQATGEVLSRFPYGKLSEIEKTVPALLLEISREIYARYKGSGGATLIAVYLWKDTVRFWCLGDSDLFLYRGGRLYAMNSRHEYGNALLGEVLEGKRTLRSVRDASQTSALSEYMGAETPQVDCTLRPFPLLQEDRLLLCSDGVTDTLTLEEIAAALTFPPERGCTRLEENIRQVGRSHQDNYTAVMIDCAGFLRP